MLFSEFMENTGCRDNEYNHKLYSRLEIIYMHDDTISKAEIYDMGRKLMDNTPSKETLEIIAKMQAEIEYHKHEIAHYKDQRDIKKWMLDNVAETKEEKARYRREMKYYNDCIRDEKHEIAKCKFVIEN